VRSNRVVLVAVIAVLVGACTGSGAPSRPAPGAASASPVASAARSVEPGAGAAELTIYGAASLKSALEATKTAYEAANPGTSLTVSTDSSAALATQIEQGAPADVFLSADTTNAKELVDAGLADGGAVDFAGNALTVIVPTDDPAGIASPTDLATAGVRIIAAGEEVPITRYATELIQNLAGEPGYPADYAAAYAANIVTREDNVKAVVAKIELGEGDAGIVYVTDAAASDAVRVIDVPPSANVQATYAGVVVKASAHPEAARAFLAWLAGPDGQAILSTFGFLPPPA
jgi:molybdate transport system substrate-binding protein